MIKKLSELATSISQVGVTHAFGIPGGGYSLELIDYLDKVNIPFYRTHHEASAAIMAGTIGRLSGNPGLAISIKGPGLTNMLPGISVCHFENFPLLAMCESYDEKSPKLIGHKGIDQDGLVNKISKGAYYLNDDINRFKSAFNLSRSETPGPVLINLARGGKKVIIYKSLKNRKLSKTISRLINKCKKPIIIAGSSALRLGLSNELSKLNLPIFTSLAAKGLIDENLNYSVGIYTGSGEKIAPEFQLISESDLIIGLGVRENELLNPEPFKFESINFAFSSDYTSDCFSHNLFCERKFSLDIIKSLSKIKWGFDEIKISKENLNKYLLGNEAFLPATVFNFLSNYFSNYRLIVDTGYFCTVAEHLVKVKNSSSFLCAANSRYMGTSIPMGIASSLYDPSIPSIVCVGDGGIGMYISDIKIAVENNLPIIIMLLSDRGFGSIRKRSIPNELIQSPTNIIEPSWIKFFKSFGIKSFTVDSLSKVKKAMTSWESGPLFIECFFDEILYMNMVNDLRD